MIKTLIAMISLVVVLPLSAQDAVNAPAVVSAEDFALNELVSLLQQTNSLRADVEQLIMDQDGRELQEVSAQLLMQKPANFRWEVTKPYSELMVTDGSKVWRYESDLEQVTVGNFDAELDRTPIMLLNGNTEDIRASYKVSAATMADGVRQRFTLQPLQADSLFERMGLTFNGAVLEEMQFEDSLGQQTSLSFRAVQRNEEMEATTFHFVPPAGVDVIDATLD